MVAARVLPSSAWLLPLRSQGHVVLYDTLTGDELFRYKLPRKVGVAALLLTGTSDDLQARPHPACCSSSFGCCATRALEADGLLPALATAPHWTGPCG